MKRILLILGLLLLLLTGALALAPILFKDKIRALVEAQANGALKAKVAFGEVGLSFLRNFPHARISVSDFSVAGIGDFEGDTLAQGERFVLVADLWSILSGGEIQLRRLILDKPRLDLIVLENGAANWDIVPADTSAPAPEAGGSGFRAALRAYELNDATILYTDPTLPMSLRLDGVQHSGSGDLTATEFTLDTRTEIAALTLEYDGIAYLSKARARADGRVKIALDPVIRMDFLQDRLLVNDLSADLSGYFAMPGEDIVLDMSLQALPSNVKALLSLVPGVYSAEFAQVKAGGSLALGASLKGTLNDSLMPGFGLDVKVEDGSLQYPGLPQPVSNIRLDLSLHNPDGDLEHTALDLRALHADLGANPLDAQLRTRGLSRIEVEGQVKARLQLEELTRMFPIEGTTLRGLFSIDATASGVYDSLQDAFPKVDARMTMENGFVQQAAYPATLSELGFHALLKDADGSMKSALFTLPDFRFLLDGEPVEGSLAVQNFADPAYRLEARGRLDLEKLMQLYPIEGMTLKGKVIAEDFATSGVYSAVEAGRYTELPTRGSLRLEGFSYASPDLPGTLSIPSAELAFTPERMDLRGLRGTLGRSDFALGGYVSNYLAYALLENQPLQGALTLESRLLDLNEFFAAGEGAAPAPASGEVPPAQPLEAFPLPENVNLRLDASVAELRYDNLQLSDFQGNINIVDESANLEDLVFRMLGSEVKMSGSYATRDLRRPAYSFYFDMKELPIREALAYFPSIRKFAPALSAVEGVCNTEFGISGRLKPDMTPVLEEINSLGLFQVLRGALRNTPMLTALSDKTKIPALAGLDLKEVAGKFAIEDGFLIISPLDLRVKDILLQVGGRQNLSGAMDYAVKIDAPSTQVDQAAIGALSKLTGVALQTSDRVQVNLRVLGSVSDPQVRGAGGGTGSQVQDQLVEAAEDKLGQALGTDVELNKDSLKARAQEARQQAEDSLRAASDRLQQQAADTARAAYERARKAAEEEAARKAQELLGPGAQEQLKNLKDRFGLPKKKGG